MHALTPSSSCDRSAQKYIQVLLSWNSLALLMSTMVDPCYSAASVMLWIYLSWDILLASWWLVFNCTIILGILNYLCTWHARTISAELLQWLSGCFSCTALVWCHHSPSYPNTESLPDYTQSHYQRTQQSFYAWFDRGIFIHNDSYLLSACQKWQNLFPFPDLSQTVQLNYCLINYYEYLWKFHSFEFSHES